MTSAVLQQLIILENVIQQYLTLESLDNDTDAPIKNDKQHKDINNINPLIWHLEGVEGLEGDALHHMNIFYALLKDWYCRKDYTTALLTKMGYDK